MAFACRTCVAAICGGACRWTDGARAGTEHRHDQARRLTFTSLDNECLAAAAESGGGYCILCSDAAAGYRRYASTRKIPLQVLNATRGAKKYGLYHLNNVNAYHSRLKRWIRPFNGVSTKYLANYLVWFLSQDSINLMPRSVVANRYLDHSHPTTVFTTTKSLL